MFCILISSFGLQFDRVMFFVDTGATNNRRVLKFDVLEKIHLNCRPSKVNSC